MKVVRPVQIHVLFVLAYGVNNDEKRVAHMLDTMIKDFVDEHQLGNDFVDIARKWFVTVASEVELHCNGASGRPFFLGVNGCQGAGKTTLCAFIQHYLTKVCGLSTVVMSLDDFYLTRAQRLVIGKHHPLFKTRGVPGTHDIKLLSSVLEKLSNGVSVDIPRFCKATDDRYDESQWQTVNGRVDVVLLEGWCWGVEPQSEQQLRFPVNDLEMKFDSTGAWRTRVNNCLNQHYKPLYKLMDKWLMIVAPSFGSVYKWRLQQEQKLRQYAPASSHIMSDSQIEEFIQYFQRLTLHAIDTLPQQCDWLLKVDECRNIVQFSTR